MTPAEELAAKKHGDNPKPRNTGKQQERIECTVRVHRLALGLTMEDVAAAVGICPTTAFRIEHGCECQISTAKKLAKFFGKSIEELWP